MTGIVYINKYTLKIETGLILHVTVTQSQKIYIATIW
jgi:hypothetical protein